MPLPSADKCNLPADRRRLAAIVPAAGSGYRMGALKPLLPLGGETVIARVVRIFHTAGVADVRVVVGHRAVELIPAIEKAGAAWIENPCFDRGMLSSIQIAVADLPPSVEGFFLLPADIPLVRVDTVAALADAWPGCGCPILYPTFTGRRGHPPLVPSAWKREILAYSGASGMQGFLKSHGAEAKELPVIDAGILFDMDTRQDYREACARLEKEHIPTDAECLALMALRFGDKAPVIDHCRCVAQVAVQIAEALEHAGCPVDRALVRAASLVHDVAKDEPDHAAAGERLLNELGFPALAEIVGEHMDLRGTERREPGEKEIVYLADKMVQGDSPVDLCGRFEDKLRRHGKDPAIRAAIHRRREQALEVVAHIERRIGRPMDSVVKPSRA
jgi:CTP:molybdopterin cytidylyltransferase MocA